MKYRFILRVTYPSDKPDLHQQFSDMIGNLQGSVLVTPGKRLAEPMDIQREALGRACRP